MNDEFNPAAKEGDGKKQASEKRLVVALVLPQRVAGRERIIAQGSSRRSVYSGEQLNQAI